MKQDSVVFKIKGMQLDVSASVANEEYSYENWNIRIINNGGNSMSIVSERGTKKIEVQTDDNCSYNVNDITVLGYAVIDKYVVLFGKVSLEDCIARLEMSDDTITLKNLYKGDLGFSINNPITTLPYFENKDIQKVYWTDGLNQPRVINIMTDGSKYTDKSFDFVSDIKVGIDTKAVIEKVADSVGNFPSGIIQYAVTYLNKNGSETAIVYLSPIHYLAYKNRAGSPELKINNHFKICIYNIDISYDYLCLYSIIRTSIDSTPLVRKVKEYKINKNDLYSKLEIGDFYCTLYGYKPEEITLQLEDSSLVLLSELDYSHEDDLDFYKLPELNISNIILSSVSHNEKIKVLGSLTDIVTMDPIDNYTRFKFEGENLMYTKYIDCMEFVDNNTQGSLISDTELLFKGSDIITAETMTLKDNTLFLGNINLKSNPLAVLESIDTSKININFKSSTITKCVLGTDNFPYSQYSLDKSNADITSFKIGEYYRFGFQALHKTGKWSDVIYIKDSLVQLNTTLLLPVTIDSVHNTIQLNKVSAETLIPSDIVNTLLDNDYIMIRGVVVYPNSESRRIVCQGILNPTMYSAKNRMNKTFTHFSSYFFRPLCLDDDYNTEKNSTTLPDTQLPIGELVIPNKYCLTSEHDCIPGNEIAVQDWNNRKTAIYNFTEDDIEGIKEGKRDYMAVDCGMLTFNSPDIEFDDTLKNISYDGTDVLLIGIAGLNGVISASTMTFIGGTSSYKDANYNTGNLVKEVPVLDKSIDKPCTTMECRFDVNDDKTNTIIFPFQPAGGIVYGYDDSVASKYPQVLLKRMSNLKSFTTLYYYDSLKDSQQYLDKESIQLYDSDLPIILKFDDYLKTGNNAVYYGNLDYIESTTSFTRWYNTSAYATTSDGVTYPTTVKKSKEETRAIATPIRFKSSPHLVVNCNKLLPSIGSGYYNREIISFYSSKGFSRKGLELDYNKSIKSALLIAEVIRPNTTPELIFGGSDASSLKYNLWNIGGHAVSLLHDEIATITYDRGDTYIQRYDCLKTYPYSDKDVNLIVEIGSFFLETHINLEGRYDRNIGLDDNLAMNNTNFNLINDIYSLKDNYFTYQTLDKDLFNVSEFPNSVTWSTEKQVGSMSDNWTKINLSSIIDANGVYGKINKLITYNNRIIGFLDKGVFDLMFNSRVQIPTSDNIPIQVGNTFKVEGIQYISDKIGCTNGFTVCSTVKGVYFIDTIQKTVYLLQNNQFTDIGKSMGMSTFFKENTVTDKWSLNSELAFKSIYDYNTNDIYFLSQKYCIAFNEDLNKFTSFYDYNKANYIFNVNGKNYAIGNNKYIYELRAADNGDYNKIIDEDSKVSIDYLVNKEPFVDKIFTNISAIADYTDKGKYAENFFDILAVKNQYLRGKVNLSYSKNYNSTLRKRFNIYYAYIPKNEYNKRDRIRSPWCHIILTKSNGFPDKFVLHDVTVYYLK